MSRNRMRTSRNLLLIFSLLLFSKVTWSDFIQARKDACKGGKLVVIVDGYSTGAEYVARLRERGCRVIHIHTVRSPQPYYLDSFQPYAHLYEPLSSTILEDLKTESDYLKLLGDLRTLGVAHVIPGTETGVVSANTIARDLGLLFNGGDHIEALTDKYLLAKLLRENKKPYVPSLLADLRTTQRDVNMWLHEEREPGIEKPSWPLVVKPRASAGTQGFSVVSDFQEMAHAILELTRPGSLDYAGKPIRSVVIQPFIQRNEANYNFLTYSLRADSGIHKTTTFLTDSWAYLKKANPVRNHETGRERLYKVYQVDTLRTKTELEESHPQADREVALDLHRILSIRAGLSHIEEFEGGLVYDAGFRAPGAKLTGLMELNGVPQIDLALDSYLNPEIIPEVLASLKSVEGRTFSLAMIAPDSREGLKLEWNQYAAFLRHPLVERSILPNLSYFPEPEKIYKPTIDTDTSPGMLRFKVSSDLEMTQISDLYNAHIKYISPGSVNRQILTIKNWPLRLCI